MPISAVIMGFKIWKSKQDQVFQVLPMITLLKSLGQISEHIARRCKKEFLDQLG